MYLLYYAETEKPTLTFTDIVFTIEMGDEIFTFESFINFMIFFKYFKTPF